ncbi:MAG: site-2 protease family protein [Gammaproteobacteria bacterium]
MDTEDDRPLRNKDPGVLKGLLVGGLVGALAAAALLAIGNSSSGSDLSELRLIQQLGRADATLTGWDLLVLPVLFLIVLGAHEVGHLIGGMSQGMRFLMLIVGPFGWHASVAGPRFEWNTNVALMGGLAATLPTEVGASLRRQMLVLVAGGPLASLLLTVLAVALASLSDPRFAAYGIFVAATSFGIFLVTLIPVRTGGFMSDGMQIIDLLRGGSAVIERSAIMQIFAQSLDGVRPRDWDVSTVDELQRIGPDDPLRRTGATLYLLYRAMDSHNTTDIERYGREIEEGLASYPTGFKQSLHVELAICGWLKGDAEAVRRHLGESRGGVVEKSRRLLAQAALARLESRSEDCERHRLLAIKALAKASDAGQGKLTEDQLAML